MHIQFSGPALLLAAFVTQPAVAASSVVRQESNALAFQCYLAAENESPAFVNVALCDRSLAEEALDSKDRASTFVNRGILKMQSQQLDAAAADFDSAIALDAGLGDAWLNKGVALLRKDDGGPAARAALTAALERGASRPAVAHYARGIANEMEGDVRAAYEDYVRASALEPQWDKPRAELTRFTVRATGN